MPCDEAMSINLGRLKYGSGEISLVLPEEGGEHSWQVRIDPVRLPYLHISSLGYTGGESITAFSLHSSDGQESDCGMRCS